MGILIYASLDFFKSFEMGQLELRQFNKEIS